MVVSFNWLVDYLYYLLLHASQHDLSCAEARQQSARAGGVPMHYSNVTRVGGAPIDGGVPMHYSNVAAVIFEESNFVFSPLPPYANRLEKF